MKKTYLKPTIQVVRLPHQHQLLVGTNPRSINTNLDTEEDLEIEDTPKDFWSR